VGQFRVLQDGNVFDLYRPLYVVRAVTSRKFQCVEHKTNTCEISVGKHLGKPKKDIEG
jgi:hypothetical protein